MVFKKERRQFARAEVKWPATILTSNPEAPGEIKNISQVGASIVCHELPPTGQEFRLEIQPPNRQSIIVSAKPIWAIENDSLEISDRFILGVIFEYISEDDIKFLGDVVDKDLRGKNLKKP